MKKGFYFVLALFLTIGIFGGGWLVPRAQAGEVASVQAVIPHTVIQRVVKTPVNGLFGAILASGQVIYVYPKTGIIVFGSLYTNKGVNLTQKTIAEVQDEAVKGILSSINYKYAVKIGDGPVKVIEFANLDCPFCRMAEKLFETDAALRKKVTRYVFFIPQPSIHPHSMAMTRYFFSQPKDKRIKLVHEIMVGLKFKGDVPPKFTATKNALRRINYNMSFAYHHHIYGVPFFIIGGKAVNGINVKSILNLTGIKAVNIGKLNSTLHSR